MRAASAAPCFLVVLFVCASGARAQMPDDRATHSLVVDDYMSPAAGAENLLTVQYALAALEDRWLPLRLGREDSRVGLTLGVLYRAGKFLMLDLPQDHMLMVVAHEVFGHGARFRELGDGRIRYGFDVPIPWGAGEAVTKFNGRFPVSPLAGLSVSASGIEAQNVLADSLARRAAERGRLHYREAWLYFESRVAGLGYILSASPNSSDSHDVASFIDQFESACTSPCTPLTRRRLQRRALLMLADPLLYYALYGVGASYIAGGHLDGPLPRVRIGDMQMMPSVGYALTPYGDEWTAGAAIRQTTANGTPPRLRSVGVRIGSTGASTTWAVGARLANLVRLKGLPIDGRLEVWRQPDYLASATSNPQQLGGSMTGTLVLPVPAVLKTAWVTGVHVTAGYKSDGYVPGEQLSRGFLLRAGVQIDRSR